MDILIEVILEIYMELMLLVIPEKNAAKKHIWMAKIMAILVVLGVFALVIWGCVRIMDHNDLWGIVPIAIAVVISLAQIIAGIVLYKKHH